VQGKAADTVNNQSRLPGALKEVKGGC